jgi:hypothetical protein
LRGEIGPSEALKVEERLGVVVADIGEVFLICQLDANVLDMSFKTHPLSDKPPRVSVLQDLESGAGLRDVEIAAYNSAGKLADDYTFAQVGITSATAGAASTSSMGRCRRPTPPTTSIPAMR